MEAIVLLAKDDSFIMNAKTHAKKAGAAKDPKNESAESRKKRLAPSKNLKGNVAILIERGRLMGF
jgi:hypothetical protein